MKEYLQSLVEPLLKNPKDLRISESSDELGILLLVDVHHSDMGSVIGKEGKTISAIRTLVHIKGMIERKRVSVRVNEPLGNKKV